LYFTKSSQHKPSVQIGNGAEKGESYDLLIPGKTLEMN